jgi:glutamyl-Q tRNA(Asp) synthetase
MHTTVTRFAPSPTGLIHLGSAYSALFAEHAARESGGRFLLRIEDIDRTRCRPEFTGAIFEDLAWLGLSWEEPVRVQSEHFADYRAALARLDAKGLVYPCFCTRTEIMAEIAAAGGAPHLADPHGAQGPLYPGTCRRLSADERAARLARGDDHAIRLDSAKAAAQAGPLSWHDRARGEQAARPELLGDAVLARKDTPTSYHLAVTLDDHLQGITLVTRGEDLFVATHTHRLLQALLGLGVPDYYHHKLITGPDGRRFAKRDRALTLRAMREAGRTPAEVRTMAGIAD